MIPTQTNEEKNETSSFIYKRIFDAKAIELFKQKLYETSWDDIQVSQNPNDAYKAFLNKFSDSYIFFPKKKIELKSKDLKSPWITKGIKKSSKRKQRLYEKYLKNREKNSKWNIKLIKNFLNR